MANQIATWSFCREVFEAEIKEPRHPGRERQPEAWEILAGILEHDVADEAG